jgi:hypothetical protein
LIQILQHHDDAELTQMIEEELARRKTDDVPSLYLFTGRPPAMIDTYLSPKHDEPPKSP